MSLEEALAQILDSEAEEEEAEGLTVDEEYTNWIISLVF